MIARSRIFIPLAWLLGTRIGVSILSLGGIMALSGCTRGTNLNVVNHSTAELTNVVATGSGFTRSIGSIPAGAQRKVAISPRSESALRLDFDAKGKHFKSLPQGYFEKGTHTKLTATVSPDFTVSVDTY